MFFNPSSTLLSPPFSFFFLILLQLLCLSPLSLAQDVVVNVSDTPPALTQPFTGDDIPVNFRDRIRALSSSSPVSSRLSANRTAQSLLLPTFHLFDTLYSEIALRRSRRHSLACNLSNRDRFSILAVTRLKVFQIGLLNDTCFSYIDATSNTSSISTFHSPLSTLRAAQDALFYASAHMSLPDDSNWTDAHAPFNIAATRVHREGQTCTKESVLAVRKQARWYIRSRMTNKHTRLYMGERQRHVVIEWVPSTFGQSLHAVHRRLDNDSSLLNATTVVNMWGGTGIDNRDNDDDSLVNALTEAFRRNEVQVQLAADAITPSNVAILALPMLLNFVPVAFVATDLNALGVALYVVFTDVVSVVPFVVKGVELVMSASPKRPVLIAYFGGNDSLGLMEIAAVTCSGAPAFHTVGIVFIAVGLVALVVGVAVEVAALSYMNALRKRKSVEGETRANEDAQQSLVEGPFGTVFMQYSGNGLFGTREGEIEEAYFVRAQQIEDAMARRNAVDIGEHGDEEDAQSKPRKMSTWRKRFK